jgi:hypothetical protein
MKIKKFSQVNEYFGDLPIKMNDIAKLKYLSNLDNVGSADDMQNSLEEINELLNELYPNIEENNK